MSPETKELLKTTWAKVIPISDVAAGLFYERLFILDPSLQRLFRNADMKEQRRKLVQTLNAVINSVDDLPSLIPTLEILGRDHVRCGGIGGTPRDLGGQSHPEAVGRIPNIRIVAVAVGRPDIMLVILP